MNLFHRIVFLPAIFVAVLLFTSCQKEIKLDEQAANDHNLIVKFKAVVDTGNLQFGKTYLNFFDEPYSVSKFKFYVHGFEMINTDSGKIITVNKKNYYLIDFSDSTSTALRLQIQPYLYNRIGFVVGVDSARNVSGAQTDALDPAKGMFWTWNTGYIMAKLEGNSPLAATPNHAFEYHIGGFRQTENVVKKLTILFPSAQSIDLKPGKTTEITITANVNTWFFNPNNISLKNNPVCTTPNVLAVQIAENYSKMFTIVSIVKD